MTDKMVVKKYDPVVRKHVEFKEGKINFSKIYALGLRHLYLVMNSFPRVLDLIYWPTVQIFLWGFISKFFTLNSEYYNNTVGVILTAAILYDFLFRASISFFRFFNFNDLWSSCRESINLA